MLAPVSTRGRNGVRLKDQVAVITGGASGMGRATPRGHGESVRFIPAGLVMSHKLPKTSGRNSRYSGITKGSTGAAPELRKR